MNHGRWLVIFTKSVLPPHLGHCLYWWKGSLNGRKKNRDSRKWRKKNPKMWRFQPSHLRWGKVTYYYLQRATLKSLSKSPQVGLTFAALPSWGAFLPRHVAPPAPSECSTTDTEHLQRVQLLDGMELTTFPLWVRWSQGEFQPKKGHI